MAQYTTIPANGWTLGYLKDRAPRRDPVRPALRCVVKRGITGNSPVFRAVSRGHGALLPRGGDAGRLRVYAGKQNTVTVRT